MIKGRAPRILSYLRALMLSVALIVLAGVGTAVAAASTVRVYVPHVKVNRPYRVTAQGFAAGRKHLYLFVESRKCGASSFTACTPSGSARMPWCSACRSRRTSPPGVP